ncbi:hypothetical protein L873DRAFT_1299615, partial [Choiromyces venosus 120613-1]
KNTTTCRRREERQGIYVSELLTPIGRLGDGAACQILKCSRDICLDREKLLDQIKNKAISAFEIEFPEYQALFQFNNTKNNNKYAENELWVLNMNMTDGGKYVKPIYTTYVLDESYPDGGYYQSMVQNNGTPKGLKTVLIEWSL